MVTTFDKLLIGGRWEQPSSTAQLDVISPATEEVVARVPLVGADDVDRAVKSAQNAFASGEWSDLGPSQRGKLLGALADLLEERAEALGQAVTQCMGAPISFAAMQPWAAGATLRANAALADELPSVEVRMGMAAPASVEHEPVGVVAAIPAWNGSLFMNVLKLAPALAAGCTVVVKPAAEAPVDGMLLAEALHDVGFPEGVVSVLPGGGDVGRALVDHPGVDMVSFTGSLATGRQVGARCGEQLKRVILELGGKSAAIVLPDADASVVAAGMQFGMFGNSGQMCNAFTRLLVPASRHDEIVDAIVEMVNSLVVGDPFDMATNVGPLGSAQQRARVEELIASGVRDGARVVVGGGRPAHLPKGWYVEPTVLTNVDNSLEVAREEIFGPVLCVIPYEGGDDEAIRIANDSPYGLHGAVFTPDDERAYRVARGVRTGTFSINGFVANPGVPFGGFKCSGIGRESGIEGLRAYQEIKTISLTPKLEQDLAAATAGARTDI